MHACSPLTSAPPRSRRQDMMKKDMNFINAWRKLPLAWGCQVWSYKTRISAKTSFVFRQICHIQRVYRRPNMNAPPCSRVPKPTKKKNEWCKFHPWMSKMIALQDKRVRGPRNRNALDRKRFVEGVTLLGENNISQCVILESEFCRSSTRKYLRWQNIFNKIQKHIIEKKKEIREYLNIRVRRKWEG